MSGYGGYGSGYGFGGFGLRRLLIFLLVIATIFSLVSFGGY
ncbi:sporulation protein YjcZ [Salinithrix halophila]|uniref:Sporulation protein YjcZ n=1 Tax=Salinithrix halophila TaxID=1485204 RepID=A0ABV8JMU6_9BACL